MAEVNLLQSGQSLTPGLSKPEQSTSALRESQMDAEPKVVLPSQNLPTGSQSGISQKAVSQVGSQDLNSMMQDMNAQLEKLNNYLRFEKDEATDKMVFMIKDSQTDEVIRQIPSEEFLAVSKNIADYLEARKQFSEDGFPSGLFTNEQA